MATGGVEIPTTEEDRCSICLQTPEEPTTLPCKHTFCKPCISQYLCSKENKPKLKEQTFSCPVCRTDLTSYSVSSPEFKRMNVETTRKFDCRPCKQRTQKEGLATKWCRECQEAFCDDCLLYHNSFAFSKDHEISSLDEMEAEEGIEYYGDYSDKCSTHPEQIAEIYCFDHEQLCCISCLTKIHRKCEKVHTIRDLVSKEEIFIDQHGLLPLQADLSKIQTTTNELLQEKKADKTKVEQSFLDIDESMNGTILKIKDNLDALMISFRKELHLKQDEYESKIDPIIKELETFKEAVDTVIRKLVFIQNYGTPAQTFIHLEKTKKEVIKVLEERLKLALSKNRLESQLILNNVVQQMEKLSTLGTVQLVEKRDIATSIFSTKISETFCKDVFLNSIEDEQDRNSTADGSKKRKSRKFFINKFKVPVKGKMKFNKKA